MRMAITDREPAHIELTTPLSRPNSPARFSAKAGRDQNSFCLQRSGLRPYPAIIPILSIFLLFPPKLSASEDITVAPGDVLQVFIPGADQSDQTYTVTISGEIDLGIYGKPKIAGKSMKEAEELLRQHLSKYLKSVSGIYLLLKQRNRIVLITGCVVNPGVVTIEPTDDLWQAVHRAGGLATCADATRITFFRNGKELDVDLRSYLSKDAEAPVPELLTGDTIFVPSGPGLSPENGVIESFLSAEALRHKVFVLGAVNSPGMYNLTPGTDILTLVVAAGGPTANANLGSVVLLTREQSLRVNLNREVLGKKRSRALMPDEGGVIVYLPTLQENIDDRLGLYINVMGGFTRTGHIPVSGPLKLIDAIGLAGGYAQGAKRRNLRIVEEGPGYTLVTRYNLKRYLKKGGVMGRVIVKPGSTLVVGQINTDIVQITMQSLNLISMISSTFLLWINYSAAITNSK